jgi:hypothetical protein
MRAALETGPTRTRQIPQGSESRLNISVVFTSEAGTVVALKTAAALANRLGGRITLVVPEVVSYQLPLNEPPVRRDWNEKRLRAIASRVPVETTVRFYLCRDRNETLASVLRPHSLVVIGGAKRWWLTPEYRLARKLRRLGHEVVLTETE